jgi:hypothetical protein
VNESEGIHDPDWERFGIHPPGAFMPVGNPTRWGAQLTTQLADFSTQATPQILSMSTRDGYSRSWTLLGTLGLSSSLWGTALADIVIVRLEITMGVGQAQITHSIVLLGPDTTTFLPGGSGLCITQYWRNGGPYYAIPEGTSPQQQRAFAIVGGLTGQSISVRAVYQIGATGSPALPSPSVLSLLLNPYAAGEGL